MINDAGPMIYDFLKIAEIAGIKSSYSEIQHDLWKIPQKLKNLPDNYQAVYIFSAPLLDNKVIKIGKCGPLSKARYLSQHYNPQSCGSNLSKTLLQNDEFWDSIHLVKPEENFIGEWVKRNTDRDNFIFSENLGSHYLSLFEIFLQCRYNPIFEGGS
ncbi:hypothetical protein [Pelolinea submarina]|uniref:Uncharacterized protein n=1 Tax=Pelolinea submarina TaxID=913107 RepID=A0A347ZSK8_9CHLR|nr:hypothetical protein [Pelolinea submarina]REG11143.1 hypothetical protein DFR64_1020 [Pelolinea submarina]BBB48289.1 hypothetical protein Pelsub_P1517 [Pelolinea submarina]